MPGKQEENHLEKWIEGKSRVGPKKSFRIIKVYVIRPTQVQVQIELAQSLVLYRALRKFVVSSRAEIFCDRGSWCCTGDSWKRVKRRHDACDVDVGMLV